MIYRVTAMNIINADVTVTMITMIIIYLEAKMGIDMVMARTIPGVMTGRTVDIKINESPITQIGTKIKI